LLEVVISIQATKWKDFERASHSTPPEVMPDYHLPVADRRVRSLWGPQLSYITVVVYSTSAADAMKTRKVAD
jgi:hypothetical protein